MTVSPETQLRFLARDVLPVLEAVRDGYVYHPSFEVLRDEQPVAVWMSLGDYRRAVRLAGELDGL